MGSGGQRPSISLAAIPTQKNEGLQQQKSQVLGEQKKSRGAWQGCSMKMAAGPHTASELPLEDLLKLYGYDLSDPPRQPHKEHHRLAASLPGMTLDEGQITETEDRFHEVEEEEEKEKEEEASPDDLTSSVISNATDVLPHHPQDKDKDKLVISSSDEDSDDNFIPSNEERKDIMVGSMYQAKISPLSPYSTLQERACHSEDQLLWNPSVLSSRAVEEFLLSVQRRGDQAEAAHTLLPGDIVKDSEQALFELVKCNFNAEEALRRLRFNVKVFSEELCGWSEEECRGFEHGYRVYGKNFHLIQSNKVRTRSVGECVEYYYMWKKSERHEYFTQQATRISRRKYNLYSGNMEDGEQDGDLAELERDCSSQGSSQHEPPSTQPALALVKRELGMRMLELCGGVCQSPPRVQQLFGPFSPLLAMEGLQEPTLNSLSPGSCPPSPPGQLQLQSPHLSPGAYSPVDPHHLGSGFYQFQLQGPFLPEGLSAEPDCGSAAGGSATQRLQLDFTLPPTCPLSPSIAPSEYGAISSFLAPTPIQHPRSLTQ